MAEFNQRMAQGSVMASNTVVRPMGSVVRPASGVYSTQRRDMASSLFSRLRKKKPPGTGGPMLPPAP